MTEKEKSIHKQREGLCFGDLKIISFFGRDKYNSFLYNCKCVCGKEITLSYSRLRQGKKTHCGCKYIDKKTKHGMYNTRLYFVHQTMKARCYNKNSHKYKRYGGRGITVCDDWLGENGFVNFYNWSMENGCKDNLSIDRIDNNKGYSPDNCRWSDAITQQNNTSTNVFLTYKGETKTMKQWADEYNIPYYTFVARIKRRKWDIERAIKTEVRSAKKRTIC